VPCIYFEKFNPQQSTSELEDIVTSHGGVLTRSKRDATHIVIMNDPDKKIKQPDQDYLRTLELSGDKVRVHWWYFPDSYDQWLSQSEIEGKPEPPREPQGAWRVQERFLRDLKKYNEWMNELDYEEDDVEEEDGGAGGDVKESSDDTEEDVPIQNQRKRKNDNSNAGKPAKVSKFWVRKHRLGTQSSTTEPVIQGPTGWPTSNPKGDTRDIHEIEESQWINGCTYVNVSSGQATEEEHFPYSAPYIQKFAETNEAGESDLKPPVVQHLLPRHARWFSLETVHPFERRGMHEFFARRSKKKLEMYIKLRNFIVETYAAAPYRNLSLDRCLDLVDGDYHVTARIHDFLEKWGIINHKCTSFNQVHYASELETGYPVLAPSKHSKLELVKPTSKKKSDAATEEEEDRIQRPGDILFSDKRSRAREMERKDRRAACQGPNILSTEQPVKITKSGLVKDTGGRCAVTGKVCRKDRYVLRQDRNYILSPEAFHNGEYPEYLSEEDFVRETLEGELFQGNEAQQGGQSRLMGKASELALLEAVSAFKDDFDSISDHAQISGKEQALMQFLRLPIMDSFIEQQNIKMDTELSTDPDKKDKHLNVPYKKTAKNQLIANLALVSTKISPHVSAAMAKAALLQLGKIEEKAIQEASATSNGVKEEGVKAEASGSMDVEDVKENEDAKEASSKPEEKNNVKKVEIDFNEVVDAAAMDDVIQHAFKTGAQLARELAAEEERKMKLLVNKMCDVVLQRISVKMTEMSKLDGWLKTEQEAAAKYKEKWMMELHGMMKDPAVAKLMRRRGE